jgi:hypothetical protein
MPFRSETIRRGTEVELIRSLYATQSVTTIMSIVYVASFTVLTVERRNIFLLAFAVAGIFSSAARSAVLLFGKSRVASPTLDIVGARRTRTSFCNFVLSIRLFAGCLCRLRLCLPELGALRYADYLSFGWIWRGRSSRNRT